MKTFLRTGLSLLLLPALAHAQFLVPTGQDRYVSGDANADDFVTFLVDSESDTAADFGPFVSTASATIVHPDCGANGGSSQNSEIFANSFVGTGSAFADTFVDVSPWLAQSAGASVATVDFEVATKVRYHLLGSVTAFDNGVAVADLRVLGGSFLAGNASIGEGEVDIDESGALTPGTTYRVSFRAFGSAESNGCCFDFAFGEYDMGLELTPLAVNYCVAGANSAGPGALLSLGGSTSIATNDFRIEAAGAPPGVFGLVYYGPNQVQLAFGDGFRCVGGTTYRVQPPELVDGAGNYSKTIDFTSGPAAAGGGQILPLSTWNFQLWFRDPMGPGGTGFNTSDGLEVIFCP